MVALQGVLQLEDASLVVIGKVRLLAGCVELDEVALFGLFGLFGGRWCEGFLDFIGNRGLILLRVRIVYFVALSFYVKEFVEEEFFFLGGGGYVNKLCYITSLAEAFKSFVF